MSAHLMVKDYATSQLDAERRAARIRLCASAPRDTHSAGIGMLDERAERRIDVYLFAGAVIALPIVLTMLYWRI